MALATFNPPLPPEPGTGRQPKLNILETEFGDGYTSSTPNGYNHIRQTLSLAWSGLTLPEAQVMDNFFTQQGGTIPFFYTHYSYGVAKRWLCNEWDMKNDAGLWRFTAKLDEDFGHAG
jgi:phage-related protein